MTSTRNKSVNGRCSSIIDTQNKTIPTLQISRASLISVKKRPTVAHTINSIKPKSPPKRIMSITKGRGIAIVLGVCVIDLNSSEATISQIADSQSYSRTLQKVNLNEPQKIIVPSYSNEESESKFVQLLTQQFPHIPVISLPRKFFNDEDGKQYIYNYCLQEDTAGLIVGVTKKYYCLAAISGMFRYIAQNEGFSYANNSIKFSYQGADGTMQIDTITAKNLELVSSTTGQQSNNTLLGILGRTHTPMGKRLLRMNILQPPCSLDVIKDRQDAVEELCKSEEVIFNIQSCLKQLIDLDHTIAYLVKIPNQTTKTTLLAVQHAEMKVNQVIGLKQTIKTIQSLATCLPQPTDDNVENFILLGTVYKILSNGIFSDMEQEISNVINEEVGIQTTSLGIRNQKCYAVKAGVNGLLDVARQTYKETTEDIYELASAYNETYRLQTKLSFSAANGFYLTLPESQLTNGNLPSEFINVVKKRKVLQFTTLELLQKNSRINESLTEVYLMSDRIVSELLKKFRDNINVLYKSSEAIALLDMLTSFASCNLSSDYVRPEFSNTLAIKSGRHPILDHILSFPLVPNDTFASLSSSFQFVTGPNMSGKSTYLRQVALLTIMAQIGSYVPAEYACFRLTDQLLSRLANDNTFTDIGTSSFMSEMRETAYLLQHVTPNSLVIIDELGRGTSPSDALGITAAVCEELIKTRAFSFFATHLHELPRTLDSYPNVVNLQFKVNVTKTSENECIIDYQYKVEDGKLSTKHHYGLQTAQILGFPKEVLSCAYKIVCELKNDRSSLLDQQNKDKITQDRKLLWFMDKVLQLGQSKLPEDQLHEQMYNLQKDMLDDEETMI